MADRGGDDGALRRIPLRQLPLVGRDSYIELDGESVVLHVPRLLAGGAAWRIPLAGVVVVDPSSGGSRDSGTRGLTFVEPVSLPYLATATAWKAPNLQLLFEAPRELPRLRLRAALNPSLRRLVRGAVVDGVALRALDAWAAVDAAAAAGIPRTTTPVSWLTDHRETTRDPDMAAAARAADRAHLRVRLGVTALLPVVVATAWWTQRSGSGWGAAAVAAESAAALALPVVARRSRRA